MMFSHDNLRLLGVFALFLAISTTTTMALATNPSPDDAVKEPSPSSPPFSTSTSSSATTSDILLESVTTVSPAFTGYWSTNSMYQLEEEQALESGKPRVKRQAAVQQCGKRLADAVQAVCKGHLYSGLNRQRRSVAEFVDLLAPKDTMIVRRRFRRSITDECCKQSCTDDDIAKYCDGGRRWNTSAVVNGSGNN